jgi:hypothetical protein
MLLSLCERGWEKGVQLDYAAVGRGTARKHIHSHPHVCDFEVKSASQEEPRNSL